MANKNFKVKNGLDIQSPLDVSMGGTGQTSLSNALNAMLPSQSGNSAKILSTDGTNPTWIASPNGYTRGDNDSHPASPTVGDLFYNTTYSYFESYTANGWFPIAAAPGIPTSVVATNQGSGRAYNNGRASIAFSAATNAGAPSSFVVTPTPTTSPSTFTGTTSPITVTNLASSTQYTYTVVATSPYGTSSASSASSGVTATTVPQAPTIGAVTAGNAQAEVTFTAGATGGATISSYTVTSTPDSITANGSTSPITITGLTNGTEYTFTVTATNTNGTSGASSASSAVTPNSWAPESGYDAISTVTLSASASSITFSGIPSGYKHLELRGIARVTGSSNEACKLTFNGDTSSIYAEHHLNGNGSSAVAGGNSSYASGAMYWGMGMPYASDTFGANVTTILDYSNTNKYKTVRSLDGFDANGSGGIELVSSLWQSTSAITSITLTPNSGASFNTYTQFALYGVK